MTVAGTPSIGGVAWSFTQSKDTLAVALTWPINAQRVELGGSQSPSVSAYCSSACFWWRQVAGGVCVSSTECGRGGWYASLIPEYLNKAKIRFAVLSAGLGLVVWILGAA